MQPIETARAIAFLAAVLLVYVLLARLLIRRLLRKVRKLPNTETRVSLWASRVIFGLAAIGSVCIAYGFLVEPNWLEVVPVRVESAKVPKGAKPIRIVHISDLHCESTPRLEPKLPEVIAAQRPDLIVFTGDALNTPEGLPVFKGCLTKLAKLAPTYAVRGNWDVWYWSHLDLFGGTGVRELDSESVTLDVRGTPVRIAGIPVDSERELGRVLDAIPAGGFRLLLHHYPDEILEASRHKADLYCAGHIHGGQIALPFYGALVTLSKFGKRFESGLHRVGTTNLYVTRGVGMEGGDTPRVRFCARPEVTVIEILPASRP